MAATSRAKEPEPHRKWDDPPYKAVLRSFAVVHAVMAALFAAAALLLIAVAARTGWSAIVAGLDRASSSSIIEAVGMLAVAVVALQIAQTIAEEEVVRDSHISAPTRVRRFLSRFLVVIVVALSIEGLVAAVKAVHEDLTGLALRGGPASSRRRRCSQDGASSCARTATPRSSSPRRWPRRSARIASWSEAMTTFVRVALARPRLPRARAGGARRARRGRARQGRGLPRLRARGDRRDALPVGAGDARATRPGRARVVRRASTCGR